MYVGSVLLTCESLGHVRCAVWCGMPFCFRDPFRSKDSIDPKYLRTAQAAYLLEELEFTLQDTQRFPRRRPNTASISILALARESLMRDMTKAIYSIYMHFRPFSNLIAY